MNIKKRLFISNILMVVVPVCIALVTAMVCMAILVFLVSNGKATALLDYYHLDEAQEIATEAVSENDWGLLEREEGNFVRQRIAVFIESSVGSAREYGLKGIEPASSLKTALIDLGGTGRVATRTGELVSSYVEANGITYTVVCYLYAPSYGDTEEAHDQVVLACVVALLVVVISTLLVSRALVRFVFPHIVQPLDILAAGTHALRDGDLSYRISYTNQDEFLPVCEDFNEMADRLTRSHDEIMRSEENRKIMIAGISHDVRSPLTSIKAYVEGLIDGVARTDDERRAYLEVIRDKSDDIDQLLSRLFLFVKLDMDDYPCKFRICEVNGEVQSFVQTVQSDYALRGLTIQVEQCDKECFVKADPLLASTVLTNLLDNCVVHGGKDHMSVVIRITTHDGWVYLEAMDDGYGVAAEKRKNLFEVFYRADEARNNPALGSGLGLAMVKRSIEQMDGKVDAHESPWGGLAIRIALPRIEDESLQE